MSETHDATTSTESATPTAGVPSADPSVGGGPAQVETTGDGSQVRGASHAGLRYFILRLTMLVTVGGVLALLGVKGWPLLFGAVLGSGVLSLFLFARPREEAARNLEARMAGRSTRAAAAPNLPGDSA